jgi:hypothetical protein
MLLLNEKKREFVIVSEQRAYIVIIDSRTADMQGMLERLLHSCGLTPEVIDTVDPRTELRTRFYDSLTERQRDVVRGVLARLGNYEISVALDIAEGNVADHLTRIYLALERFEQQSDPATPCKASNRASLIHFFGNYFDDLPE